MQIFVKTMDGKTLVIQVAGPEDSVENLKKTVHDKTGVPVSEMRLICRGRQLEKGKLSDYDVQQNNTLHLVLRLLGGFHLWRYKNRNVLLSLLLFVSSRKGFPFWRQISNLCFFRHALVKGSICCCIIPWREYHFMNLEVWGGDDEYVGVFHNHNQRK